jgi:hypothetical protein
MKQLLFLLLAIFVCEAKLTAQNGAAIPTATETIQQSANTSLKTSKPADSIESASLNSQSSNPVTVKIPAGTPIEVEVAYTVSSLDMKPGELLSFRVLIPVVIDGVTAIESNALVTARVTVSKRGGHWGKAGHLAWAMEDVVASDNTRVLLDPSTHSRNEAVWNMESKGKQGQPGAKMGQDSVKGTSHKGEVTTKTVIAAAIFPPLAPLALMNGFKRGENAVLPEGKRFVVAVRNDSSVSPNHKN